MNKFKFIYNAKLLADDGLIINPLIFENLDNNSWHSNIENYLKFIY